MGDKRPIEDLVRKAATESESNRKGQAQAAEQASALKGTASDEADVVLKQSETSADKLLDEAAKRASKLLTEAANEADRLKRENFEKAEAVKETAKLLATNVERAINPLKFAIEQHLVAINKSIAVAEASLEQGTAVRKIVEELARRNGGPRE